MTQALYLRTAAIDSLMQAVEVPDLNRKQQAALLGMRYKPFWRLTNVGVKANSLAIAALLNGVDAFCARYGRPKPEFEDLFEIREVEERLEAAIAA